MSSFKVKIEWSNYKLSRLPVREYITASSFERWPEEWPNEAWSLKISFTVPPTGHLDVGLAEFISPQAPSWRIKSGEILLMHEGGRVSAKITVL